MHRVSGSEKGMRVSEIDWTCNKDCWCHIPVRGQTQPPCYQCVLVHCSLSYKDNFAPSAPELPPEDISNDQTSQAQVSGAAGGLDSSLNSLVFTRRNELPSAVSTPLSSSHFITVDESTLGATALPVSTVNSLRSKRRGASGSSVTSPLSSEYEESSQLCSPDLHASDLEPTSNYRTDQFHMFSETTGHSEIPEPNILSNDAQKDDERTVSDMADSEEAEYAPTAEHESVTPILETQVNRKSWISDTEGNTTLLEDTQDPQDSGDLSSRLRMLILGAEEQELHDSHKKEVGSPRRPTNWTVNSKGLTVCICGDAHLCYSRRRPTNHSARRRHHQSQVPHRPRMSTSSDARNRSSHTHGHSVSQQPHRQRLTTSGEARNRSFHPHGHLPQRELEFRRINRIHRRESGTEAPNRHGDLMFSQCYGTV